MKSTPWWKISVFCGLVAVGLCALAIWLPNPWGWMGVLVFVAVTFAVYLLNPLLFYRNAIWMILASWLTLSAAAGFSASLQLKEGTFGSFAISNIGASFNIGVVVLVCVLAFLDILQNKHAADGMRNLLAMIRQGGPSDDIELVRLANQTDRGKLAIQAIQQYSEFFAIDTSKLTKRDQAEIALKQIDNISGRFVWTQIWSTVRILALLVIIVLVGGPVIGRVLGPTQRPVVFSFEDNTGIFRQPLTVDLAFGSWQLSKPVSDGQVVIVVPGHINQIDSVVSSDPRFTLEPKGPFPIPEDLALKIKVVAQGQIPPSEFPPESVVADMPTREMVEGTTPKVAAEDANLWYRNITGKELELFILNCSAVYSRPSGHWMGWPFRPSNEFELFQNFEANSKGWFAFVVRDLATGNNFYLTCRPIFESKDTYLTVKENDGVYSAEITTVEPQ